MIKEALTEAIARVMANHITELNQLSDETLILNVIDLKSNTHFVIEVDMTVDERELA